MAKVKGILHSEKASGTLVSSLVARCGKYIRVAGGNSNSNPTAAQKAQMIKFAGAADAWKKDVSKDIQKEWNDLAIFAREFDNNVAYLDKDVIRVWNIGGKEYQQCITTFYYNGYQYFSSAFMKWGPGGWDNYPHAPKVFRQS